MSYLCLTNFTYLNDRSTARWNIRLGESPDSSGFFTYGGCNWKVEMIYDRPQLRSVMVRGGYVSPINRDVTKGAVDEYIRLSIEEFYAKKLWSLERKVQFEFSQNSDSFQLFVENLDPVLVNQLMHSDCIRDGGLYLQWEFIRFEEVDKNFVQDSQLVPKQLEPRPTEVVPDNDWKEHSENILNMLFNEDDCDVTLNVSGRSFKAHRSILSSRSPVFHQMFKHDLKEKETGTVDITDCDPGAFEAYLRYLYSGKFDIITVDNVSNLYRISDKYASKTLVQKCVCFMKDNLSTDNCGEFSSVILNDLDASSYLEAAKRFFADIYVIKFLEHKPFQANDEIKL